MIRKSRDDHPVTVKRTYQPNTPVTVPGDSMVIAAPHAKDIDNNAHATPSPTPPVAAIATTLQPPAASTQEMGKM